MARFMRSYGKSAIRPPAVIGPPVTFRPVDINLVDQRATRFRTRAVHSRIGAPTVVTPISVTTVVFDGVKVRLTNQRAAQTAARKVRIRIGPPAVVAAAAINRPVAVHLADQRALRNLRRTRSTIRPPAVISQTVLPKPQIHLADQRAVRQAIRSVHSRLRPPSVVGTNPPFRPVTIKLADQSPIRAAKRGAHSSLKGPVIPAPAAAPILIRLRTTLADQRCAQLRARSFHSRIRPPAVIALNQPFRPTQIRLVRIRPPRVHSRISPPGVTALSNLAFDAGTTGVIAPDGEGREGRVRTGTLAAGRRGRIDQDGTGRLDKPHEGTLE